MHYFSPGRILLQALLKYVSMEKIYASLSAFQCFPMIVCGLLCNVNMVKTNSYNMHNCSPKQWADYWWQLVSFCTVVLFQTLESEGLQLQSQVAKNTRLLASNMWRAYLVYNKSDTKQKNNKLFECHIENEVTMSKVSEFHIPRPMYQQIICKFNYRANAIGLFPYFWT